MRTIFYSGAALMLMMGSASASAYLVSGTGEGSTYKTGYAPAIVEALSPITESVFFGKVEDRDGAGTVDNLRTCAEETETLCFGIGQGDVVATSQEVVYGDVCVLRADLAPEYAFAFVGNKQIGDYSDLRANWGDGRITMVTSESSSGSLATLKTLRDAAGFPDAKIKTLPTWNDVIAEVKSNPRSVGFTVRYPDPTGFLSELVDDHGLAVMGVAERSLRHEKHTNGEPVYTVNLDTPYDTQGLMGSGGMATTPALGAPVVLFGNCPEKLGEFAADAKEAHTKIVELPASAFDVNLGWLSDIQSRIANKSQEVGGDKAWDWVDNMAKKTGDLISN